MNSFSLAFQKLPHRRLMSLLSRILPNRYTTTDKALYFVETLKWQNLPKHLIGAWGRTYRRIYSFNYTGPGHKALQVKIKTLNWAMFRNHQVYTSCNKHAFVQRASLGQYTMRHQLTKQFSPGDHEVYRAVSLLVNPIFSVLNHWKQ